MNHHLTHWPGHSSQLLVPLLLSTSTLAAAVGAAAAWCTPSTIVFGPVSILDRHGTRASPQSVHDASKPADTAKHVA